jgi:hypothetical protein
VISFIKSSEGKTALVGVWKFKTIVSSSSSPGLFNSSSIPFNVNDPDVSPAKMVT